MVESMSNRRDKVSICDLLTLSGLQPGFSWPLVWARGPQKASGTMAEHHFLGTSHK